MKDWKARFNQQVAITLQEPDHLQGVRRAPIKVAPPPDRVYDDRPLPEVRKSLQNAMRKYMADPDPQHILLLKPPPGTGKTYAGVAFAHWAYLTTQRRVLYAGPRHDFYGDVMNEVVKQNAPTDLWYEWLPRQHKPDIPERDTCYMAPQIAAWQQKGYQGMSFCSQICGWEYVKDQCGYHAQKRRNNPIIFGQHQHVVLGHPLADEFGVVIGDESPASAFLRLWSIPTEFIVPPDMNPNDKLFGLLRRIQLMAEDGLALHGKPLYDQLGAEYVLEALEGMRMTQADLVIEPKLDIAADVEDAPYAYLPYAVNLLSREALGAAAKEPFAPRLYLSKRGLTMELRNYVNEKMPRHVVWFDGTGAPELYATMFGREVESVEVQLPLAGRVFQVVDRQNNKTSIMHTDQATGAVTPNERAADALKMVQFVTQQYGYQNPAVITFEKLVPFFRKGGFQRIAHFYGQRGTNSFVDCDVVFIVGTPMPSQSDVERTARMLFFREMRQFENTWTTADRDYAYKARTGDGVAFPTSQFADKRLNYVLYSQREDEIVQAAHRVRPIFREADVWLLTNIPLPDLPPTKLLTSRTIYNIPEKVNTNMWLTFLSTMEKLANDNPNGIVTAAQLEEIPGMPEKKTLLEYFTELSARFPERWGPPPVALQRKGRGRPPRALQMTFSEDGVTVESDPMEDWPEPTQEQIYQIEEIDE